MKNKLLYIGGDDQEFERIKKICENVFDVFSWIDDTNNLSILPLNKIYILVSLSREIPLDECQQIENFLNFNKVKLLNAKALFVVAKKEYLNLGFVRMLKDYSNYTSEIVEENSSIISLNSYLSDLIESPVQSKDNFFQVKTHLLNSLQISPCDIFLKINDTKFVKIINENESAGFNDILKKYSTDTNDNFFILSNHFKFFHKFAIDKIFDEKNFKENQDQLYYSKISNDIMIIAKDFGVNDHLIDSVNGNYQQVFKQYQNNKHLLGLLNHFKNDTQSEIVKHSHLTALFCHLLASKFSWCSSQIKKNLSLSCLLHDVDLLDKNYENLEFSYQNEIEDRNSKTQFNQHSKSIATVLSNLDSVPSDVIHIVSNHHEGIGELGYPNIKAANQLSPVQCLFIVAHTFSIELKRSNYSLEEKENILKKTQTICSNKSFFQYLDILATELNQLN
jgi:HD-GYP domain-containing protein (c-di-GMP phosphodiesterase class II)